MPREFFLLFVFALLIGMSAIAHELGLSEAIGALMAGVILSETSARARDRGALPQLPRHLRARSSSSSSASPSTSERSPRSAGCIALAVVFSVVGKLGAGRSAAGRVGGFTLAPEPQRRRRARRPRRVHRHPRPGGVRQPADLHADAADLVAFAGLYVLATALIGVLLMKESKRLGRRLFPTPPRLAPEGGTHGPRAP